MKAHVIVLVLPEKPKDKWVDKSQTIAVLNVDFHRLARVRFCKVAPYCKLHTSPFEENQLFKTLRPAK